MWFCPRPPGKDGQQLKFELFKVEIQNCHFGSFACPHWRGMAFYFDIPFMMVPLYWGKWFIDVLGPWYILVIIAAAGVNLPAVESAPFFHAHVETGYERVNVLDPHLSFPNSLGKGPFPIP